MLHTRERERERQHERAVGSTERVWCKLVFVWASALPARTTTATRAFTLASFTTLLYTHTHCEHCQTGCRQKLSAKTCCSCYCALSLSLTRMHCTHCVKLAPLIVVAVHFNALFRTLFPSLCLPSLFAFACVQQPLQFE